MAAGGGRCRCPLGALLAVVAAVAAAGWARAEPKEEQFIGLIGKNEVYGDTRQEVCVYVKVFTNSPFLVCMDLALSQQKVIDPVYLWTGPDGRYLQAYREADRADQISVRFSVMHCTLQTDASFVEELKKILNSTISHLTCHITALSCKCHSIRTPKNGLQHALFVNFLVIPFAPGWEEVCHEVPYDFVVINKRVQQAAELIGKFFRQLGYVFKYELQAVPTIQYVNNSFSMTPIDSCRPGFGKNHHTHQNCASCCVVCSPGTCSPDNGVTCWTCDSPQARMYGAVSCY